MRGTLLATRRARGIVVPSCPRQGVCPLFTVPAMAPALALWRGLYCDSKPERCERLRQLRLGVVPPQNLLPNGKLLDLVQP